MIKGFAYEEHYSVKDLQGIDLQSLPPMIWNIAPILLHLAKQGELEEIPYRNELEAARRPSDLFKWAKTYLAEAACLVNVMKPLAYEYVHYKEALQSV